MKILLLEDELPIAEDLRVRVESLGHRVMGPAANCSAALELIWRERPDVAILDTHLGSETCEVVINECELQGIPVLISAAHAADEMPDFVGELQVLAKPHADAALAAALLSFGSASSSVSSAL